MSLWRLFSFISAHYLAMDLPVTSCLWPFLVACRALLWGPALSSSVVAFSQGLPLLDRAETCQGVLPRSASLPAPQTCPTMLSHHTYQPTMFIQHTCRGAPLGRKVHIFHLSLRFIKITDCLLPLQTSASPRIRTPEEHMASSPHFALLSFCPVTISNLSFMGTVRFMWFSDKLLGKRNQLSLLINCFTHNFILSYGATFFFFNFF